MAKRIQLASTGGPEVLEFIDFTPAEPGAGEVRVRNQAVGLNFIDIYVRTGLYPVPSLPSGLGTEGAGVVDAVGEGVTHLKVGDRVAYAQGPLGAYGELHTLPAEKVVCLPDGVDVETAAASMLKGLTVQYLLRQTYPLQGGETILFHAAAGWRRLDRLSVGQVARREADWHRQLTREGGACREERRLGHHRLHQGNVVERVRELTGGAMVDVVYDSVGKDTWEMSLDCLKKRGLMVSFGNASGPVEGVNIGILNQKGSLFVTRPSLNGYADTRERLEAMSEELFAMIESGKITIDIAQRFALADAAKAQQALAARQTTGSTILVP